MWVPERVWEQHLVTAIAEAGIEYTVLDDFHFQRAGCPDDEVFGYYLTEDDGRLLKVFPGSETLRYIMPFQEPHATYEFLRRLAERRPGSTVVFADDGEKFGTWPKTFDHVYTHGWLNRFCDMLVANRDWLEPTTFARAVDATLPAGQDLPARRLVPRDDRVGAAARVAARASRTASSGWPRLPDAGERQAVLPGRRVLAQLQGASIPKATRCTRGCWGSRSGWPRPRPARTADPDYLEVARQELYRGQCNCPYWHGSFGGLYLPHLRNAIYRSLIAADNALDDAEGAIGPASQLEVGDFNLDARQEVRLENDRLIALVRPAPGRAHLRAGRPSQCASNVLATLDRRPEAYHASDPRSRGRNAHGSSGARPWPVGSPDRISFKQPGLDRLLVYDRHPRKALVDHFYPVDVTLDDLIACRDVERGDFAIGTYLAKIQREPRSGRAGHGAAGPCRRPFDPASARRSSWLPASPSLVGPLRARGPPARRVPPLRRRDQPGGHGRPRARPLLLRPGRHAARAARRPARLAPYRAA